MSEQPVRVLPYAPPPPRRGYGAAWFRAIVTVMATSLVFGISGGCLGLVIGLLAPGYYRTVFRDTNQSFSPPEAGFGLGMGQGAAAGVWVGVALAGILTWRETRMCAGPNAASEPDAGSR